MLFLMSDFLWFRFTITVWYQENFVKPFPWLESIRHPSNIYTRKLEFVENFARKIMPFSKVAKVIKTLIWVNFTKITKPKYLENTALVLQLLTSLFTSSIFKAEKGLLLSQKRIILWKFLTIRMVFHFAKNCTLKNKQNFVLTFSWNERFNLLFKKKRRRVVQYLHLLQTLENFTHPKNVAGNQCSRSDPVIFFLFPGNGSIILDTVAD